MDEVHYKLGDEEIDWIKKYIENASPSGNEVNGQKLWLEYLRPFIDEHITDNYGNVAAIVNPGQKFRVVIEAHADEIGWYVHRISPTGFLHVEKNGGSDPEIAPSQKVRIHTERGVVPGIFGWPAIHTRKDPSAQTEPTADAIFIDCGCSNDKQVEDLGVQIGDCITYDSGLSILNRQYLVGRGQDNKVGGFIIATVARLIRANKVQLPFSLYIVNSVQEEVGLRGAALMASRIKPDCAIVTDATHATNTPLVNKNKQGDIELGLGPVVTKAPSVHNKLREYLVNTAREGKIPFQLAVSSKKTGTDTDSFAYTATGIPAALVALPLRYMHTTVETTHKRDIENTINLLYNAIASLTPDINLKYF
jgi:putative aminopeptidase FrvX